MYKPNVFSTSRLADFATLQGLTAQTGFSPGDWPYVVLKETIDNLLDAAEDEGLAPRATITIEDHAIVVADEGPGVAPETVTRILDYDRQTSSRAAYIGPSRGAQGNAMQCFIAMPYVLDGRQRRNRNRKPRRAARKIIGLDTTARTGAIMVRNDSKVQTLADLRNVPIAVTWHAGTFYAAIEAMEAAGVPFEEIKLIHANDRLDALLSGKTEAAALMEPLVSRAAEAGCRQIAELRWRGGIVAGDDVDDETAAKITRALNRAVDWLRQNEERSRDELLRDLKPEQRKTGMMPELLGVQSYKTEEFQEKVDWMMDRGLLKEKPVYADVVRGK